ncbi:MAG: PspC domain-containing protein [Solobacterium sp.]|nr:PspC domain-containing protein [Solobacterium sp.]
MDKKLYRSDNNRMFMGVCAGIGEYFNIDPAVVRLLFMILCFIYGGGFLLYLFAAIIIPKREY